MELALLIARIILLILKGIASIEATSKTASISGAAFSELWNRLPDKYK